MGEPTGHIQTVEHYPAVKTDEAPTRAATRMNPESTLLRDGADVKGHTVYGPIYKKCQQARP